jgi:hypothetical protein
MTEAPVIQPDDPPNHTGIAARAPLPELVTEHGNAGRIRAVILGRQRPTEERFTPGNGKHSDKTICAFRSVRCWDVLFGAGRATSSRRAPSSDPIRRAHGGQTT